MADHFRHIINRFIRFHLFYSDPNFQNTQRYLLLFVPGSCICPYFGFNGYTDYRPAAEGKRKTSYAEKIEYGYRDFP